MTGPRPEHAWFAIADDDMELARRALGPDRPLPALACFHAQQCAEKYLKGYLVARGVSFRFVHDLGYLIDLCAGLDPSICRPIASCRHPEPIRRNRTLSRRSRPSTRHRSGA